MAFNSNPQAVAFVQSVIRPYTEYEVGSYFRAKTLLDQFTAQGLATTIPNDANVIDDHATQDGRPIFTNAQVNIILARAQEKVTDFEASANLKLNTLLAGAVTPR